MKVHIRRISPASLALTLGIFYGGIGLFVSILGAVGGLGSDQPVGMLIIQPFVSALVGVSVGFVLAWIYNFISRFTKGLLIEYNEASRYED